jgi:hypothetical protein
VDPGQIEHPGDLAYQVVVRYDLVQLELVEKLLLIVALFGPCAMSDLSPECAPKRTFAQRL